MQSGETCRIYQFTQGRSISCITIFDRHADDMVNRETAGDLIGEK